MTQQTGSGAWRDFDRVHLERIRLAADVIMELGDAIPNALEADLVILKDRVEHLLLLPD